MEKLRKTEAPEVVIVVPKRALLIQSIVNLKLLKKEADNLGLKINIVTQDKLGKMLIKKAGIFLQQKLEDDMGELDTADDERAFQSGKELKKEIDQAELGEVNSRRKRDLEKIGSASYFVSGVGEDRASSRVAGWEELEELKEKETLSGAGVVEKRKMDMDNDAAAREFGSRKKSTFSMDVAGPADANHASRVVRSAAKPTAATSLSGNISQGRKINVNDPLASNDFAEIPFSESKRDYKQTIQSGYEPKQKENLRDKQLENFFYANNFSDKKRENYASKKQEAGGDAGGPAYNVSRNIADGPARNATHSASGGGFLKVMAIFGAIVLALGLAYAAYLYVPKATVTIFAKKEVKSADMTIAGEVNATDIDYDKSIVPAKLMEFDEEVAKTFDATGSKNVSNQKAKGKITIYNEFSTSAQPLVATTRFLSDDQKIFRLVQGITVPGTTNVGGETKPGVVEADVVADEAGDSHNIPATNFTIPGFKSSGNDKYTKIYAKSSAAMSGGGNGSDTAKVVTDKDISDAKDKISLEINSAIKSKVKDAAAGMVTLDDAIAMDEPVYRVSNSAGETANNFEIKVQAHVRALVFSENDIKKAANSVIAKSGNGKINIDSGAVLVDYGKSSADFKLGTIEIKLHASNVMQPNIDLEKLKKDILGKNSDQLSEYLKTYSNIEKVEVEYFPQLFISKIPTNEKRVEVNLDATMPE